MGLKAIQEHKGKYLFLGGCCDGRITDIIGIPPDLITRAVLGQNGQCIGHHSYEKYSISVDGDLHRIYVCKEDPQTADATDEQLIALMLSKLHIIAAEGL